MPKLIVLSCAFASICILAVYHTHSVRAADNPAPAHAGFEYATLSRIGTNASWHAPGDHRKTVKPFDLYNDLGGKENESSFETNMLLSQIGTHGWELVSVVDDQTSRTYYFKRSS
jgi:hypothetical protein